MDERPVAPHYTSYVDGIGWVNEGFRDEGYCPVCCDPQRRSAWRRRQRAQQDAREASQREASELLAQAQSIDAQRAAQRNEGPFAYSNGDEYDGKPSTVFESECHLGEWLAYERHGFGTMIFEDGSVYRGEWIRGQQHGEGTLTGRSFLRKKQAL